MCVIFNLNLTLKLAIKICVLIFEWCTKGEFRFSGLPNALGEYDESPAIMAKHIKVCCNSLFIYHLKVGNRACLPSINLCNTLKFEYIILFHKDAIISFCILTSFSKTGEVYAFKHIFVVVDLEHKATFSELDCFLHLPGIRPKLSKSLYCISARVFVLRRGDCSPL